jgi:predicted GTPase
LDIDFVFLAYSDLSHDEVMHKASRVQACGASFALLGPRHTQLVSQRPVIAITAVRTGAGKSPIAQMLGRHMSDAGYRVGIIRHPMPYGDLNRQTVERLATGDDLDKFQCTIEEREEYEPYLELGLVVFAGVDYAQILARAEAESDVILWDGGNNDFSFVRPGLSVVVVDALRPGHETAYYPGETNLRAADVLVINKVGQAKPALLAEVRHRLRQYNPTAQVIEGDLDIEADRPELIEGRRVLVVEDGPTLTHGGMTYGAGVVAARQYGAGELVDPRPSAVGSIADIFSRYTNLQSVLPALGYSPQQCGELTETIEKSHAEVVIDASPARLDRLLKLSIPVVHVRYQFRQVSGPQLTELVDRFVSDQEQSQPSSLADR